MEQSPRAHLGFSQSSTEQNGLAFGFRSASVVSGLPVRCHLW